MCEFIDSVTMASEETPATLATPGPAEGSSFPGLRQAQSPAVDANLLVDMPGENADSEMASSHGNAWAVPDAGPAQKKAECEQLQNAVDEVVSFCFMGGIKIRYNFIHTFFSC